MATASSRHNPATPEQAREKGRASGLRGVVLADCPYPKGSDLWETWRSGWVESREELGRTTTVDVWGFPVERS